MKKIFDSDGNQTSFVRAGRFPISCFVCVALLTGVLVACGGKSSESGQPEVVSLPEGELGELAVEMREIIKQTDDVGSEVRNYIDFPDVYTPEGSQILGLVIYLDSNLEDGSDSLPWAKTQLSYAAENTDAENVISNINSQFEANPEWNVDRVDESGEIKHTRLSSSSLEGTESKLDITVQQQSDGPVVTNIVYETGYSDLEWENLVTKYSSWKDDITLPVESAFSSVVVEIGQIVTTLPPAIEGDFDRHYFSVDLGVYVEKASTEQEMHEEILNMAEESDDFVVTDSDPEMTSIKLDSPDFANTSFFNYFVEESDLHIINFSAWTHLPGQ